MPTSRPALYSWLVGWAAILLAPVAAGCGDGIQRHPVAGTVLVDGKPLRGKAGSVLYKPDASKGNNNPHEAGGTIDDEGGYTLFTKGQKGAPPGWYKVLVFASEKGADRENVRQPFHARFGNEKATTLAIQVVANPAPDRYDLNLTKK